jgi:hypothetical protein
MNSKFYLGNSLKAIFTTCIKAFHQLSGKQSTSNQHFNLRKEEYKGVLCIDCIIDLSRLCPMLMILSSRKKYSFR